VWFPNKTEDKTLTGTGQKTDKKKNRSASRWSLHPTRDQHLPISKAPCGEPTAIGTDSNHPN